VRRLSHYLRALEALGDEGLALASSEVLAERAGTTSAQVRKDLSIFGSFGRRGLGYEVPSLRGEIERILGLDRRWPVALVGAGRIGSALFAYPSFRERGFDICAIFDEDPAKVGCRWEGVEIRPASDLERHIRRSGIEMAILAVPAPAARTVGRVLVDAGVRAILNFAPVQLQLPDSVVVNDVNLAMEVEALSFTLSHRDRE